jgi:hypothetical protein
LQDFGRPSFAIGDYPKGTSKDRLSRRERRIVRLASGINNLMRKHPDRYEAIDAYDVARVMFRLGSDEEEFSGRSSLSLSTS